MSDPAQDIADAALLPDSSTVDGNTINNRSLPDLIEAKQFEREQAAMDDLTGFPFRVARIRPPGGR